MRIEALVAIARFITCHDDKPDSYEIWGSTERPEHPLTLGHLRDLVLPDVN